MLCTAFNHAKPPRSARGNFIPILKVTRDELPVEQGVYGGCLLCPPLPSLGSKIWSCHVNDCFIDRLFVCTINGTRETDTAIFFSSRS